MRKILFAAVIGLGLAHSSSADPVTDALFAEGIFNELPDGQQIAYDHVRSGTAAQDFVPVADGHILVVTNLAADGTRSLSMKIEADGRQREILDFPASGGNPVLMVFLESAVRSMAALTGGSPFYIRNRIKDALRQGGDLTEVDADFAGGFVAARQLTLHPFATDPSRDRMGAFADLSLRFVVADAVPGHFLLLSAETPADAVEYRETIRLTAPEAGQ
jgi:hypothetical protein